MDQTTDNNPIPLFTVDQLFGTPDYVLDSPVLTSDVKAKFASSGFADPAKLEFPIFNKAATWTSYAYLKGAGIKAPAIEGAIKKAGVVFGISADLEKLDALQVKSASTSGEFALPVGSVPGDDTAAVYPIKTAYQIEESSRGLLNDKPRMPVETFYQAATNIVKAASNLDVVLPDAIKAAGTLRYPDFEHAAAVAGQRSFVVKDETALVGYRDAVKSAKAENGLDMSKWIDAWLTLDRQHHVKYARGILDPFAAFYAGPTVDEVEKVAAETVFIAGAAVPASVVVSLPEDGIRQRFSKEAAERVIATIKTASQNPGQVTDVLGALPAHSQKELLRLALSVK